MVLLGILLGTASLKSAIFETTVVPFIRNHCLDCHDGDVGKPKGDLDLVPFSSATAAKEDPETMLRVRNALLHREMPPERKSQPSEEERNQTVRWIESEILHKDEPIPGPPMIRRLTRLEYNNSVRDLLGLQGDVFTFSERLTARRDYFAPGKGRFPDKLDISIREYGAKLPTLLRIATLPGDNKAAHGFANQGDALNITPLLLERYVTMADKIVNHVDFAHEAVRLSKLTGVTSRPRTAARSTGGSGVYLSPVSGDYAPVDNINADAPGSSDQSWLFRDHVAAAFDLGNGGVFQHPEEIGARVPGKGGVLRATFGRDHSKALLINPTEDLWFVDFATAHETSPPANITNGKKGLKSFRLSLKLDGVQETDRITSVGVVVLSRSKMAGGPVTLTAHFSSGKTRSLTDEIETGAGVDNTFFSWQAPPGEFITDISVDGSKFKGDYVLLDDLGFIVGRVADVEAKAPPVDNSPKNQVEVKGPFRVSKPDFHEFLVRAFRGPVSSADLNTYFAIYEEAIADGQEHEAALREAIRTVLSSPRFLFIVEGGSGRLSGYEIATRLSYFLWASIPDDELLTAAAEGKLATDEQIETQVRRMLGDPKAKELSESFAYQWLKLNVMLGSQPDHRIYRDFYKGEKVTMAAWFLQETLLLFETVLVENRPIMELLDPDFTWLNPALIEFYGLQEQFPEHLKAAETIDKNGRQRIDNDLWFRCKLPDRKRGGILCMGSTLTLTSLPRRTSPVYRGSWVAEAIFNRPPPPPPAMVDELGDDDAKIQENGMTLRDKLEAHRSHRACAGCHSRIDPLGFPLENFDAIGKWRESYGRFPVDATGSLWGTEYSNVVEFKDLLRTEKGFFHRGFIRHMMTYALGRELHHYDEPSIDNLLSGLEKGQGLQDLIVAIATSPTFTHAR